MLILIVQLGIPLLLIGGVAMPNKSRTLKCAQTIATGLYILAVHLAGLWLDLPWWTIWMLWFLFAVALLRGLSQRFKGRIHHRVQFVLLGGWAALGLFACWIAITAAAGRSPPGGPITNLASPLPPGRYLVVNGGNSSIINAHLETLHPQTSRQALYRGQSYGVDIVALRRDGRPTAGWQPSAPHDYAIFGTPVLSPCDGFVIRTGNARPDMPVPIPDEEVMEGNHVVLRCGQVQILLGHLKRGSVTVRPGQKVHTGQQLGNVGNSGNSGAPHLHIHAQQPGAPNSIFAANPLPIRLDGHYPVRGDRF